MCYQGGAWPSEYRGKLFMGNIHGHRINMDIPKPQGSGFVASHGKDFLLANDAWARFICAKYGPDGNVYVLDWYDKQACHDKRTEIWDRTNGRIYKVTYERSRPASAIDLAKCTNRQLAEYQGHDNEWYVRHARRLLQERSTTARVSDKGVVEENLPDGLAAGAVALASDSKDSSRLRFLWLISSMHWLRKGGGGLGENSQFFSDPSEHVRAWAVRLGSEATAWWDPLSSKYADLARTDPSAVVRLALASAAQRMPATERWDLITALAAHGEDANDHNLPLMVWYAAEPLAAEDPARALALAAKAKLPLLAFMVRRIAAMDTPESLALLVKQIGQSADPSTQRTILAGINESLKGQRKVAMPNGWPEVFAKLHDSKTAEVRNQALALAVVFGDPTALAELRKVLANPAANARRRQSALASLVGAKDPELVPVLLKLVDDTAVRGAVIRALAGYDDRATPELLVKTYPSLTAAEKRDAVNTLAARPAYAKALLDAVASKAIPVADVSADIVRQIRNLRNADLDRRIAEVWGVVRATPADRAAAIQKYKKMVNYRKDLTPDLSQGRNLFVKTCAQCHTLFGTGGKVGPDITGSNRPNLDYLLENILDPSAIIPKEYAATVLTLKNGRSITGIVKEESAAALTVATANETLTVPKSDIETREPSAVSMMPEDQLQKLSDVDVRALIGYLQSPRQIPMLATPDTAKEFFNGKDLTGWIGDPKLWSVENGEIVGKSPGIKHNQFLISDLAADDFRFSTKIKLVPNSGNSGVQFRSEPLPDGEMRGPQADVGAGWWGKLYEESARGLLTKQGGEKFVKVNDWNEYMIEAVGGHVQTWINGHKCVDIDDPKISRRGVFGLQIHAGGPMEVRFKDLKLEVK
jgi:putative heme-binding domain-containing protein